MKMRYNYSIEKQREGETDIMDKKQNCCPHCGAGAESICMELPTVVKFSMMVGENGNAMLKARVDDDR